MPPQSANTVQGPYGSSGRKGRKGRHERKEKGKGTGKRGGMAVTHFGPCLGLLNRPYFRVPQAPKRGFYEGFAPPLTAVLLSLMLAFLTS